MSWLMMNSIRASPTPSAGSCHQRSAAAGIGDVQHDLRARRGNRGDVERSLLEVGDAVVDVAASPSAHDTVTSCPSRSTRVAVAGADDRRQARARG